MQYNSFDVLENELLEKLKARDYSCKHGNNQYYANLRTVVYRLNDLIDGKWEDVHSDKGKHFILSDEFSNIVNKYCSDENDKGLANGTIKYKRYAISWFLHELGLLQCFSLTQLSPKLIVVACIKITDHNLWSEIRLFLKYLVVKEKLETDYSTLVPHYSKPYVIPSVYSIDEIKRIENSIDTSTIQGKDELNIIQQKTGNILQLPIIDEVSSALKDYLTVRPLSMAKEIFLHIYAPYNPISTGSIRNLLKKYMVVANIDIGNRKKGPHALRSSLASSMINNDISYETVRKILGHSSDNAIKHYAKIDVEKLRQYCLEPPQISGKFKAFLKAEVI